MEVFLNEELTSEAKRDVWSAYIRASGITAKLNEILNKLLQASVRPENPIDFIREELGDKPIAAEAIENMEHELEDAQREIRRLRRLLKELGIENLGEQWNDCTSRHAVVGTDNLENVANEFNDSLNIVSVNCVEKSSAELGKHEQDQQQQYGM